MLARRASGYGGESLADCCVQRTSGWMIAGGSIKNLRELRRRA
jgi:hypothetical protein